MSRCPAPTNYMAPSALIDRDEFPVFDENSIRIRSYGMDPVSRGSLLYPPLSTLFLPIFSFCHASTTSKSRRSSSHLEVSLKGCPLIHVQKPRLRAASLSKHFFLSSLYIFSRFFFLVFLLFVDDTICLVILDFVATCIAFIWTHLSRVNETFILCCWHHSTMGFPVVPFSFPLSNRSHGSVGHLPTHGLTRIFNHNDC